MKKKILIGSLLVLTLLLLMPSIPAIQQKTIEDKGYSDYVEEIKTLDDDIKLPNLYAFIVSILCWRYNNIDKILDIAVTAIEWPWYIELDVHYPLLLVVGIIMICRLGFRMGIWIRISDRLNLGWTIDVSIFDDY